jgi:hypothetical protein
MTQDTHNDLGASLISVLEVVSGDGSSIASTNGLMNSSKTARSRFM